MKKFISLVFAAAAFTSISVCGMDATNYVFSADGVFASGNPRQLPLVGRDFTTGLAVSNLQEKTAQELVNCGWYRVVANKPELGMLQYLVTTGYVFSAESGTATALYQIKDGAPVKKYTQYKIIGLLMKLGKWQQVKQYLIEHELYDLFMGAQFLSNADENFINAKKVMGQLLQIDEAVIDELLETCVDTD